ncbi:MAG: L,D-transpeptidase/peptidoglycan binding protein [Actinomycetota bacterium]|nr:L,D-transpeptidase/peptidoglycan binding protein [Actinomycetota bacterium]
MRARGTLLVLLVIGLLGLVAGVLVLDRTSRDRVADGVRAATVDIGGLRSDEAQAKLRRDVRFALDDPVVVRFESRRFALTPKQAGVRVDTDAMVREAVARSREGGIFRRTWRRLAGDDRHIDVPLAASPSDDAVGRFVGRVETVVERPAVDADVELVGGEVRVRRARPGRRLIRPRRLGREVRRRLITPGVEAPLSVRAQRVAPKVSTERMGDRYPTLLVVDRTKFRLQLYRRLHRVKTYRVSLGRIGLSTPAGRHRIITKQRNPVWHVPDEAWAGNLRGRVIPGGTRQNPLKARWLGLTEDGIGIHGTDEDDSIGRKASHGCIRMLIRDVKELYSRVDVGAPVFIG